MLSSVPFIQLVKLLELTEPSRLKETWLYWAFRYDAIHDQKLCADCERLSNQVYGYSYQVAKRWLDKNTPKSQQMIADAEERAQAYFDELFADMFSYGEWLSDRIYKPNVHPHCRCEVRKVHP